jgi:hypothetical protein
MLHRRDRLPARARLSGRPTGRLLRVPGRRLQPPLLLLRPAGQLRKRPGRLARAARLDLRRRRPPRRRGLDAPRKRETHLREHCPVQRRHRRSGHGQAGLGCSAIHTVVPSRPGTRTTPMPWMPRGSAPAWRTCTTSRPRASGSGPGSTTGVKESPSSPPPRTEAEDAARRLPQPEPPRRRGSADRLIG